MLSDTNLKVGDTATVMITFSEAVTGFDNTDITVENGTLSNVTTSDGGVTWTGTFTPTTGIEDSTNVISVGTALTDLAGNAPLAGASSANYIVDTVEPTLVSIVMDDTELKVGETANVTITFSEAVTNFDNSDITVENGTLSAVARQRWRCHLDSRLYAGRRCRRQHQCDQHRYDLDGSRGQRTTGRRNECQLRNRHQGTGRHQHRHV